MGGAVGPAVQPYVVWRAASGSAVVVAGALLSACAALPATGPKSDAIQASATAGLRSTNALPYALVDVSADTIGFLSQPNLITFQGQFPDKRPKPEQVAGVGDVLNVSIFEAAPGGLYFTPATAAGARPGNFVDLPAQAIDQKGNIYVPYAGEIPSAGRTLPDIQQAVVARLRNRAIEPQVVVSLNQQHSSVVSVLGDVNTPGVLALNSVGERLLALIAGRRSEIRSDRKLRDAATRRQKSEGAASRVVHDPRENIFIRPNDVIFLTRELPSFTALGAINQNVFGFNSEIPFDTETLRWRRPSERRADLTTTSPTRPRCLSIVIRASSSCRRWASTRPGLYTTGYRPSITSICAIPRLPPGRWLPDADQGRDVRGQRQGGRLLQALDADQQHRVNGRQHCRYGHLRKRRHQDQVVGAGPAAQAA